MDIVAAIIGLAIGVTAGYFLWIFPNRKLKLPKQCCDDPKCKRYVEVSPRGSLVVRNHFSCPKVQKQIEDLNKWWEENKDENDQIILK